MSGACDAGPEGARRSCDRRACISCAVRVSGKERSGLLTLSASVKAKKVQRNNAAKQFAVSPEGLGFIDKINRASPSILSTNRRALSVPGSLNWWSSLISGLRSDVLGQALTRGKR